MKNEVEEVLDGNKICAEYDGFPKPERGQLWNYDRSLCNSQTQNLLIKSVKNGFVEFEQPMAYKKYGIEYFNGKIFWLSTSKRNNSGWHYDSSYDWQIPVWQKLYKEVMEVNPKNKRGELLMMSHDFYRAITTGKEIDSFKILVEAIKWFNSLTTENITGRNENQ